MQKLENFALMLKEKAYNVGKMLLWALVLPMTVAFRCGRAYERMEVLYSGKWARVK